MSPMRPTSSPTGATDGGESVTAPAIARQNASSVAASPAAVVAGAVAAAGTNAPARRSSADRVGAWFQGNDNGIWVGMDRGGLAHLRERHFHAIGVAEGFPPRTAALSVCQDDSGTIWIGTGVTNIDTRHPLVALHTEE